MKKSEKVKLAIGDKIDPKTLTPSQKEAVKAFDKWFHSKKKEENQIFRIGGCAGAGKDYLIRYIIDQYDFSLHDCYVVGYTGQSVNVMRQHGIMAKTIHSTFMHSYEVPLLNKNGNVIKKRGIPQTITKWKPIKRIPSAVKLIIINEASFVSKDIEKMIAAYRCPIVEFGDPLQLPPVTGTQCFYLDNLDFFIEGVMRQHMDSDIYKLSMLIRSYSKVNINEFCNKGEVRFLTAEPSIEDTFYRFRPYFKQADMIITTTNKQRQIITDLYRSEFLHTSSPYPIKGEPLICRKNDWNMSIGEFPLTNGTIGTVLHTVAKSDVENDIHGFYVDFQPNFISNEFFEGLLCDTTFLRSPFGQEKSDLDIVKYNPAHKLEYAHAITTHLAQGAQAKRVVYLDSFGGNKEFCMRRRYTAVTRAECHLTYIIPWSQYPGWTGL